MKMKRKKEKKVGLHDATCFLLSGYTTDSLYVK
jgi:hypothetical protein